MYLFHTIYTPLGCEKTQISLQRINSWFSSEVHCLRDNQTSLCTTHLAGHKPDLCKASGWLNQQFWFKSRMEIWPRQLTQWEFRVCMTTGKLPLLLIILDFSEAFNTINYVMAWFWATLLRWDGKGTILQWLPSSLESWFQTVLLYSVAIGSWHGAGNNPLSHAF